MEFRHFIRQECASYFNVYTITLSNTPEPINYTPVLRPCCSSVFRGKAESCSYSFSLHLTVSKCTEIMVKLFYFDHFKNNYDLGMHTEMLAPPYIFLVVM